MHRIPFLFPAVCVASLLAGCGPSGPTTYPVSGTVTLDGEPLPEGRIAFRDTNGEIPSAGGEIVDGEFSFESQPGTMSVAITSRRAIPGKFDSPAPGEKVPVTEQIVPARYNTTSELTEEVVAGNNEFHFELTSDAAD